MAVQASRYVPHVDLLTQAMHVGRERLASRSRIAIDARLLRLMLQALVSHQPFNEAFYRATNPDIAAAAAAGQIADLHLHYVQLGWFEGRLGSPEMFDEAFYLATYPDVAAAVRRGDVPSALDHYARTGAAEGRIPSAALRVEVEAWMRLLRVHVQEEG